MLKQLLGHDDVVALPLRNRCVQGAPGGVDDGMNLRRDAPTRATDGIFFGPPSPPQESWCARTTEPSIKDPTSSSLKAKAVNMPCQTPRFAHSLNRLKIVFHGPKRSGRSRHGAPVFAFQMTALIKLRSPRSDGRPRPTWRSPPTISHCSLVNSCRRMGGGRSKIGRHCKPHSGTPPNLWPRQF